MHLKIKRARELLAALLKMIKEDGLTPTIKRTLNYLRRRFIAKRGRLLPSKTALTAQRALDISQWPILSICVPLYNTPERFLRDLLDSVLRQTCGNWQLCLADASDAQHADVQKIVQSYNDARICLCKIDNNGISINTNAAAKLATGAYIALADHDDILAPNAVYEMTKLFFKTGAQFAYSDEALFLKDYKRPITAHFKPDFAPDYLNGCNYICHFTAFRRELFWQMGGLDAACDGAQDHDLFLKLSEITPPIHIPKVLYYWRVHAGSTSGGTGAKPYVTAAGKRAITAHLSRVGAVATVIDGLFPSTYKVEYAILGTPLVSILIPSKDHIDDLTVCLDSIYSKTTIPNFEIVIIENNSSEEATFAAYKTLEAQYKNLHVVFYEGEFNYSKVNNFGRKFAQGDYLLLLNNDVEVIGDAWLAEMLALCTQPNIGIVGAKLYYPDDTLQHAGVITGLGGYAGHSHKYAKRGGSGYMFRVATVQNLSAVTAACLMVKASVYDEVNGLDEAFTVAFNDVDFCLRVRQAGYLVLYTPYAELYHYESKSRGLDTTKASKSRVEGEQMRMKQRWGDVLTKDPYYNPNLTLDREDFSQSDVLPKEESL